MHAVVRGRRTVDQAVRHRYPAASVASRLAAVLAGVLVAVNSSAGTAGETNGSGSAHPTAGFCQPVDGLDAGREFALDGRCRSLDRERCAYIDWRDLGDAAPAGLDQRGRNLWQVTFPGREHLWAALSVRRSPNARFCWLGGAVIGRNPLAMTWGGDSGTKARKNNFLHNEGGRIEVSGVRIHNVHDTFIAATPTAGFDIRDVWITRNRDDVFEGHLHDLTIRDALIDGTYTFLSDPDSDRPCEPDTSARDRVIVIERSLIRLERLPGPFAKPPSRWHFAPRGGHHRLWKTDRCHIGDWPRFVLRDNVFLIDGARTARTRLAAADCDLALPGDCGGVGLSRVAVCENNLFLYRRWHEWRDADRLPGPVPTPGSRFHNPANPDFLPNGRDCYQRLTDDPSAGATRGHSPLDVWHARRAAWIARRSAAANAAPLQTIPGVDVPSFADGEQIILRNRASGRCLGRSAANEVDLIDCDVLERTRLTVRHRNDGVLPAAVSLLWPDGSRLASASTPASRMARLRTVRDGSHPDDAELVIRDGLPNRSQPTRVRDPAARTHESDDSADALRRAEHWYLLPLDEFAPDSRWFAIENGGERRSFLRSRRDGVDVQGVFRRGVETALPQPRFASGDAHALQWQIESATRSERRSTDAASHLDSR